MTEDYVLADKFVKTLVPEDYKIDREHRSVFLHQEGAEKAQNFFKLENLYSYKNSLLVHRIQNALVANHIYTKDTEYTVKGDEIVLIDIFTGRLLEGRQFSEGLNQAIEAKEGVKIKPENKTLASVTYQNLFRMFKKLSGMSGTANTEEEEFLTTYNMRVIEIPTNLPVIREDQIDILHKTKDGKMFSVMGRILREHDTGRPILVGTRSVSDSEMISEKLSDIGIVHEILNAKNHAREADIVANAGLKGSITISTNMAGRGTDIKLGEGVIELGGLIVIGTERSEARRIDEQLRGRAGRQGDVGTSVFYTSLEDEILVRAGMKKVEKLLSELDEQPMQSKRFTNLITTAQRQIEGMNFDMRKTTLEYDDVVNRQRLIVYAQRQEILVHSNVLELAYATL
jgi:preprotein translocase subunit SecA